MRIELVLIILTLISVLSLSGCIQQNEEDIEQQAINACIEECQRRFVLPEWDFESARGPCLLNPIPDLPDWVCDVAHDPRQDVDNDPNNQCSAFREGTAHHFVEVDPNCELIKAV